MNASIHVENISKCYRIGVKSLVREEFLTTVFNFFRSPITNYRKYRSLYKFDDLKIGESEEEPGSLSVLWALKNVSFNVRKGERLGIIGRNGSGKSTLLKILAKITPPTRGCAEIHGRVSSLLEVGTGFHHELTGRENIYLNGTILGMKRREIDAKFQEIVAFSGVERFIDTPIKRYSSGMVVRLAFSVAAHVEPEILLIDEVLSVGDAEFQKKCVGVMRSAAHEGRTILFVSHDMGAIAQLCDRVIWLDNGELRGDGSPKEIIARYHDATSTGGLGAYGDLSGISRGPGFRAVFVNGSINGDPFVEHHVVHPLEPLVMRLTLRLPEAMQGCGFGIHFTTASGQCVYAANTRWNFGRLDFPEPGLYEFECTLERLPLVPGKYYLTLGMRTRLCQVDWLEKILCIEVLKDDVYGTMELPEETQGFFLTQTSWKLDGKVVRKM